VRLYHPPLVAPHQQPGGLRPAHPCAAPFGRPRGPSPRSGVRLRRVRGGRYAAPALPGRPCAGPVARSRSLGAARPQWAGIAPPDPPAPRRPRPWGRRGIRAAVLGGPLALARCPTSNGVSQVGIRHKTPPLRGEIYSVSPLSHAGAVKKAGRMPAARPLVSPYYRSRIQRVGAMVASVWHSSNRRT
jgi:hypothetical protein